jgi:hypothetical protein
MSQALGGAIYTALGGGHFYTTSIPYKAWCISRSTSLMSMVSERGELEWLRMEDLSGFLL